MPFRLYKGGRIMGVMSCRRDGCTQIMCDTYIDGIGYVCYECQREFKEYLIQEGAQASTEGQIHKALKTFMDTYKGRHEQGNDISVDDFFNRNTR